MNRNVINLRKNVVALILILSFLSCNQHESKQSIRKIDFNGNLNRTKELILSDIATDITYIKLESNINCYISDIKGYFIGNNYIGIQDKQLDRLLLFDINGKFIRRIGTKGKGPNEYVSIVSFDIDKNEEFVYIYTWDNYIKKYSISGELVNLLKLNFIQSKITYIDNGEFLLTFPYPASLRFNNYTFGIMNFEGKILKRMLYRNISGANPQQTLEHPYVYEYLDTLCFWEKYCDTIYSVTKDKNLVPRWVLDEPKEANSLATQKNVELKADYRNGDFYIYGFLETPKVFYINAILNNYIHKMIYEKESHLLTKLPNSASGSGYINDIDGGEYFFPDKYKNHKLYKFFELDRFIQLRRSGNLPIINAKSQTSKKKLDNLIEEHDANDNPILMIVSLK
jgi:hypothetical protein